MANLSKIKIREILQNKPQGTTDGQVIDSLLQAGHQLEGFEQPKEKGVVRKVGEFVGDVTGATGFGKAIFGAFRPASLKAVGKSLVGKEVPLEEIPETPTARQALGSTAKLLTTVGATGAKAPLLSLRGLAQSGAIGTGFGAGEALEEGKTAKEVAKAGLVTGGLTAGLTGGLGLAGKAVKPTARAISRFLFGPEGTTGFGIRFKDPKTVNEFLKTARRQPGGKQLEDITGIVNKSITEVAKKAGNEFQQAESKLIQKQLPTSKIKSGLDDTLKEFLRLKKVTPQSIETSGLSQSEVNVVKRIARDVKSANNLDTRKVLNLKRDIASLFKGTKATKKSDAIVTRLTKNLNEVLEGVDPAFREASRKFSTERDFLDKLGFNIVGTSKKNVDQTAGKLFQLAKGLDDPFTREQSEKLLVELGKRGGVDILGILRALKTAENLSPQKSLGLRAGVIREIARVLQVGVSEIAGFAGTQAQKFPGAGQGLVELNRILLRLGAGSGLK